MALHWTVDMPFLDDTEHRYIYTSPVYNELTHGGLVTPYGDIDRVNIGSGNGLLPGGTKPLPGPMFTYHQ